MKRMLYRWFFFFAAFGAPFAAFSQSYTLSPGDSISSSGLLADLAILSIEQHNQSVDTLVLKWQKVSESVPAYWDAAVCDNRMCYTTLEDTGTMIPVAPGNFGFLQLHVTPHVNLGTAVVRYEVWDSSNVALRDTLTF